MQLSPPFAQRVTAVGLGYAVEIADIDFETYSEAGFVWHEDAQKWRLPPGTSKSAKGGLFVVGAAAYAEHPTTEVVSCWYDLKDGRGRRHWRPGLPLPQDLFDHLVRGGLLEAWNVGFERWIWALVCVKKYGWPEAPFWQWRCAMAKARAHALPPSLASAGEVLRLVNQKDKDGDRLIKKFSVPRNPTKGDPRKRITIYEDVADGLKFIQYNETDIVSEAEASSKIPDLPPEELRYWQADQLINYRGAHVDREAVEDCIAIVEQCLAKYDAELHALTGGAVARASELAKLADWLRAQGIPVGTGKGSTDDEAIEALLKPWNDAVKAGQVDPLRPPPAYRALQIRQAAGSASVKKVFSMRNQLTSRDTLHDLFTFNGARTGRPTGNGPQPTNLPSSGPDVFKCPCGRHFGGLLKACPWCGLPVVPGKKPQEWDHHAAADALEVIKRRSLELVERFFVHALATVGGCLRGLYCAAPGYDLVSSDYSAIEAVVLAFIAGEKWRMDVFRTHGKIYEASASQMYGVPFEDFARVKAETGQNHPLRKKGKIAELAFGYQGWLGAARQFEMPGTDDEIKADILAWRKASPSIEWLWGGQTKGKADGIRSNAGLRSGCFDKWDQTPELFGVEGAAVAAVMNPGTVYPVMRLDGTHTGVSYLTHGDVLYCALPSGRTIKYHKPRLGQSDRGGLSLSFEGYNTNPKNGPTFQWIRMSTWGGRLVENIVQAAANCILRHATINLEAAGYAVMLHVYDEIVAMVRKGWGTVEEFERIMMQMPPFAADWPIKAAGGWRGFRYRKG